MPENSSGLELDGGFDLELNSVGDVSTVTGVAELHKDLSGRISEEIETEIIGNRLTTNKAVVLESNITGLLKDDERVVRVNDVSVLRSPGETTPDVDISINSIFGDSEFSV